MNIMLRHFRNDCKENKKYNLIIFKGFEQNEANLEQE